MKLSQVLSKEGKRALRNFVLDIEAANFSKQVRLARQRRLAGIASSTDAFQKESVSC